MPSLLIVNADDYGGDPRSTDAIAECFEAETITSASAMVWMSDTSRAAELDRERGGLPLGLHLNVTLPFTGAPPSTVREAQNRLAARLANDRFRRFGLDPRLLRSARLAVAAQLEEFRERFGREPTHVDGHNHAHLNPTVLAVLPRPLRIRGAQAPPGPPRRGLARGLRHAFLRRRFRTTDWFWAIEALVPALGGSGLEPLDRALNAGDSVELMCHPSRPREREFLLGATWSAILESRPRGSYAAL